MTIADKVKNGVNVHLSGPQILALMKSDDTLPFCVGVMSNESLNAMIDILTEDQKNELSDKGLNPIVLTLEIHEVDKSPLPEPDENT